MDLPFQKEVNRALESVLNDPEWLRFFDFDKDGELNAFEKQILQTIIVGEVTLADGKPNDWLLQRGRSLIEDRYRVLGHLSAGGQADTELAHDIQTGDAVVVKRIHLGAVEDWKSLELFQRESQVLQQLKHPRIPKFLDAFPLGDPPHTFCIVQEFIAGDPVSKRLNDGGIYTQEEVIDALNQLFTLLEYIHGHTPPVVHRDIKPANLIHNASGAIFLIDFGAASQKTETPEGGSTVVGTHGYMPLEQYMGVVTAATDLYAVGATALHMLTGVAPGKMPFTDGAIQFDEYLDADSELKTLLRALLEPVAEDRPVDVAAARKILREGRRTDMVVANRAAHALVSQDSPWLMTSKRGLVTTHYVEGTRPFRVTVQQNAIVVQDERDFDPIFLSSIGFGATAAASYFLSIVIGGILGVVLLIAGVALYRSKTFVRVEDDYVRWGIHDVEISRIKACKAKRATVVLSLADRDVELNVPAKTHEQATFVAEKIAEKIDQLKERQASLNASNSTTDSTPPAT